LPRWKGEKKRKKNVLTGSAGKGRRIGKKKKRKGGGGGKERDANLNGKPTGRT